MNTSDVRQFLPDFITNMGSTRYFAAKSPTDRDATDVTLFNNMWYGEFAITSVDVDNTIYDNQVVNILGTGFGSTQGFVYLDSIAQTINSWTDTNINITVEGGALDLGFYNIKVLKPV